MHRFIHRIAPLALALALAVAAPSAATTLSYTGASLQGSTGTLTIVPTAIAGQFQVTWSLDTTGFSPDATHTVLQSLGFKAFTDITSVSVLAGGPAGTLSWYSGISNSTPNCSTPGTTPNGFVCFDLVPDVDVTTTTLVEKSFLVTGTLDETLAWTFKGKYGTGNGWVISEAAPPVPEPTSAALFGLGALAVGARLYRRQRD